jgi:transaldolase
MTAIDDIRDIGQHVWLDDISVTMLDDGTLAGYRDHCGVSGVTANPTIFDRAIAAGDYETRIADARGTDDDVFWQLATEDVGRAADLLTKAHEASDGRTGFVSIELSPALAYSAEESIHQGVELSDRVGRPNIMVKVPGTRPGATAIEELTYLGVNVNVTLLFGLAQWHEARDAYERGLERRLADGRSLDVHSVASFFLSRIDRAVDDDLPAELRHRAAIASAAIVHDEWQAAHARERWSRLAAHGALPQQLLWASTSPKADELDETYYAQRLVAPDSVITLPSATLDALCALDHLDEPRLDRLDVAGARRTAASIDEIARPLAHVADQLQIDGVEAFADSFRSLLATISSGRRG